MSHFYTLRKRQKNKGFRYLKTLIFDKFFKKLQHYLMFLFLKSIISDN